VAVSDARDNAGVRGICLCVHACPIHMHACCAGMDESMCDIVCRIIMCSIMCVRVCEMCVGMHACLLPVLACAWLYAYVCMHSAIRMYELCVHASNLCASECPVKHVCASLVRATLFSLRTFVDQSRETERESVCAQACIKHTYKSCKYMHMHTHTHPWIHAHVTQIDLASIHARALAHTHTHTHTHMHRMCNKKKQSSEEARMHGGSLVCGTHMLVYVARQRAARHAGVVLVREKRLFKGGAEVSPFCPPRYEANDLRVLKCHAQRLCGLGVC
jgi:hypothetical protein